MDNDQASVGETPYATALPPPLSPPFFERPRPPTQQPAASPFASADTYRSPSRVGIGLHVALGALIAANMFDIGSLIRALGLLDRLGTNPQLVTPAEVDAADHRAQLMGWIGLGLALVVSGFLIALTRRLYRNVPALSNYPRRFTEGWAVGAWFVPFLNFVRPKQIVDDIWRAGAPDQPTWWPPARPPVSNLLHFWWGALIVAAVFARAADGRSVPTDIASARNAVEHGIVGDVASIVFAVLTMIVVSRLVARDLDRARTVLQHEAPRGASVTPRLIGACAVGAIALVVGLVAFQPGPASGESERDGQTDDEPERSVDPEVEGLLVLDLVVGDCFDFPANDDLQQLSSDESVMLVGVTGRPCQTPHDAEVYAIVQHPAGADAAYPNDKAMIATATDLCLAQFEKFIGSTYEDSTLDLYFMWPAKSWSIGDREIKCIALPLDEGKLTATVIDSGL